jgi:hypothetical protein
MGWPGEGGGLLAQVLFFSFNIKKEKLCTALTIIPEGRLAEQQQTHTATNVT